MRAIARAASTRSGAAFVYSLVRADLRLDALAGLPAEMFGGVPLDTRPLPGRPSRAAADAGLPLPGPPWSATSATLTEAYRSGAVSPREVVARAIDATHVLASRRPSVGPLLDSREDAARREAEASSERWRKGAPLGPLDGVPFVVKEQTAVAGLPRRAGSDLTDPSPAAADATCVARLRAAGAIVIGTTPMTEYGMTPLGYNPKRAMPRNPHGADRVAGGSSTGSAVAVAAGVVPFAVAADGGGSIRIPAALCGVFGLKPTWGRISRHGDFFDGTVNHLGPIASSTLDLARFLDATCGADPEDDQTALAPPAAPGDFAAALSRGVRGLRIGVQASEWEEASPEVAKAGRDALASLEAEGAELVDVRLERTPWAAPVGYLTIGLEALSAHWPLIREGAAFNPDLALSHAVMSRVPGAELELAGRLRAALRREMAAAFGDIDLLALPTTVTTATRVTDDEHAGGFVDARALDAMCRYAFLGNLTGLPAATAPVGLDAHRLPIGLQLVGDAWDEATVLAAVAHLERLGVARVRKPAASVG
jgi:aspartyl-tRNA(Asn)/glutamyl-tRNA(Gln) amidotransferase subunit A